MFYPVGHIQMSVSFLFYLLTRKRVIDIVRMTEKQKAFCDYFIETQNQTQAAIMAGYSKNSAKVIGAENLTKPYLREYINKRLKELESERVADAKEVLEYLTKVMRGEEQEETLIGEGKGEQSITMIGVSAKDRIKAAEQLGKVYALFTDKKEISGEVGLVQIIDDIPGGKKRDD